MPGATFQLQTHVMNGTVGPSSNSQYAGDYKKWYSYSGFTQTHIALRILEIFSFGAGVETSKDHCSGLW